MSGRRPLQTAFGAYDTQGDAAFLSPPAQKQLVVHTASVENRSGGAMDAGLLRRYGSGGFALGKLVDLDTPDLTDVTGTFPQSFFEANDDGFLIQASRPFGLIGLEIGTGAGAGGVYTFEYFNGTSYVALPALTILRSPDFTATGFEVLVFTPPFDWALGGEASVGASGLKYSIRVLSTTAPASAASIDGAFVGEFLAFKSQLADDGVLSLDYPDDTPLVLDSEEGVMPYFGTANAGNLMTVIYGTNG
jgi:hypothetical protein